MKRYLNTKPQLSPQYDESVHEQTMLFWRIKQQWYGQNVPGYIWHTGIALRKLGAIADNVELPKALRTMATNLVMEIVRGTSVTFEESPLQANTTVLTLN